MFLSQCISGRRDHPIPSRPLPLPNPPFHLPIADLAPRASRASGSSATWPISTYKGSIPPTNRRLDLPFPPAGRLRPRRRIGNSAPPIGRLWRGRFRCRCRNSRRAWGGTSRSCRLRRRILVITFCGLRGRRDRMLAWVFQLVMAWELLEGEVFLFNFFLVWHELIDVRMRKPLISFFIANLLLYLRNWESCSWTILAEWMNMYCVMHLIEYK